LAGGQALSPGLYQQPKHIEAGFLGESRESDNGVWLFHNSKIVELLIMSRAVE
jgi:hypothetical protein